MFELKIRPARESLPHYRDQDWLARQVGVSRQTVNYWESGDRIPSVANLVKLAQVLNRSLDELVSIAPAGDR